MGISRMEGREQRISELKHETTGITQYEPKIANRLKGEKKDKINMPKNKRNTKLQDPRL